MSTCARSRVKAWCASTWKTSHSSGVLNFGFVVDHSWDIYTSLTCTWERKQTLSLVLVNQLYKSLKDTNCYVSVSRSWQGCMCACQGIGNGSFLENFAYVLNEWSLGTVRANLKHMPSLKLDKQTKCGEQDRQECKTLYVTKWIDNNFVFLLSNYHDPRVVKDIERRVEYN